MAETTPEANEPLTHKINGNVRSIVKVVEIPQGEDFQEPDGYLLKDIYNAENNEGGDRFYAVLVKIQQPLQGNVTRMPARENAPVNLEKAKKKSKKSK